jgi:hypothetical protein
VAPTADNRGVQPDETSAAGGGPPALPSSPTGRVPQWVLDEAAGFPVSPVPWRAGPPEPPRRRRRGRRLLRALLAVVLVLAVGYGAAELVGPAPGVADRPGPSVDAGAPPATGPLGDRPTPPAGVARSPLGAPERAPAEGGPYRFSRLQADGITPVAYDPCRPVHYVTRPDQAPPGGADLVRAAIARVSEVTGLQFVDDGATDETTTGEREAFQPARYGDRWAPVLIAWETEEENPDLAGDRVGEGGSVAVSLGDGPQVYVTGVVSLDASQLPGILDEPGGRRVVSGIVLHELGHLVGLDHVDDDGQLMYPEARRGVSDFAGGDLSGLVQLGAGVCLPDL